MFAYWNKKICDQSGSTLIWTLVVTLVIALLALSLLLGAAAQNRKAVEGHISSQAYYTAFSGAKAIQEWFYNDADDPSSDAARFLDNLRTAPNKTMTFEFPEASLGAQAGSCIVTIQYVNSQDTNISLKAKGTYAGDTYTLEVVLNNNTLHGSASTVEPQTIDLTAYNDYAAELNAFVPDAKPLIVGRDNPDSRNNVNATVIANDTDYAAITAAGITATSNREVLYDRPRASNNYGDEVIGTFRTQIDHINEALYFDYRQFAVPPNGLLTVNPLRFGDYSDQSAPSNSPTVSTNTRLSTFSVGNTSGKDIKIRLAGQNYNSIYNNSASEYNFNSSDRYYNGLVTFDFTDSAGNTEYRSDLRYYPNEIYTDANKQNLYHPINWNSGTIYTQQTTNPVYNSGLYSRLVFSGFYHKYDWFGDYSGTGAYVANPWYGQNYQDFKNSSPGMSGNDRANTKGMPYLPVFYGPNFNLYLLDDDAKNTGALVMQGVNIVDGTIYSKRGLQLGGAMVPTGSGTEGQTKHNVNNRGPGINQSVELLYGNLAVRTMRWDQQIVNTDIVLLAPAGKTRKSEIFAPESAADPDLKKTVIDTMTKAAKPIETILGGTIYVGAGQTLTIHGTVAYNAGLMKIAPDKIIINTGGKVIVETSTSQNIDTQFYVNGGTLQIDNGAKLKADVLVYNNGTLSLGNGATPPVRASFTLTPKTDGVGIVICSNTTIDTSGALVGQGRITSLASGTAINTSSSTKTPIHYLGGTNTTQSAADDVPCNPNGNHFCAHFGGVLDTSAWNVVSVKEGL